MNYEAIAKQEGLDELRTWLYVRFMERRFGSEVTESRAWVWARWFKQDKEYESSGLYGMMILRGLYREAEKLFAKEVA